MQLRQVGAVETERPGKAGLQQDMQRGGLRAAGLNSQDQSLFGPAVVSEDQSLPFLRMSALTLVGTC